MKENNPEIVSLNEKISADEIFNITEIEGKLKTSLIGARQGCVVHIVSQS